MTHPLQALGHGASAFHKELVDGQLLPLRGDFGAFARLASLSGGFGINGQGGIRKAASCPPTDP